MLLAGYLKCFYKPADGVQHFSVFGVYIQHFIQSTKVLRMKFPSLPPN